MWDVRDLKHPRMMGLYRSAHMAIDHNQYIKGDLVYQSNYGAGLRILHIDQENYHLTEVAYFDVAPNNSPYPRFEGTWSNYPYYKSGNVAVSSIEDGLYVVKPRMGEIRQQIERGGNYYEQQRTRVIISAPMGEACPSEVQPRECLPSGA